MIKKTGLILLAVALAGCQQVSQKKSEYMRNRSNDYLTSRVYAPLRVPEGLSHPRDSEVYPLPSDVPPVGQVKPVPLEPPGFGKLN